MEKFLGRPVVAHSGHSPRLFSYHFYVRVWHLLTQQSAIITSYKRICIGMVLVVGLSIGADHDSSRLRKDGSRNVRVAMHMPEYLAL